MRQISSRSVNFVVFYWRKTPIFAIFWTSAFSGVDTWQKSDKVEHGCTTTNLSLSNDIKIVFVLQGLHGKIGAQSLTFKSVTDKQTDKKFNVLATPGSG